MSYTTVTRVLNEQDMLQAALTRVAEKKLLDPKYKIMMSGLVENYTPEESESEPKDILQLILCNKETTEKSTKIFYMEDDLNLSPKTVYNYYLYRFEPRNIVRGSAIKVFKKKQSEDDIDWFSYNGVVIQANVREISFIMVPSRGSMHRILTARQCYENQISIYKYDDSDIGPEYRDDDFDDHYVPLT